MKQEKILEVSLPVNLAHPAQVAIFGAISVVSFFAPFLLGHPQWLVGTIVNAGLFLSVIFLPKKYFLPAAIFPSLGVLARGIVFGPFTWFLIYFLPFIWLGNLILILIFAKFKRSPTSFKLTQVFGEVGLLVLAATAKFIFLFLVANIYFRLHFVPAVFLRAMGLNQLATALAGGIIAYSLWKIYLKVPKKNL